MTRTLTVRKEVWPLARPFTISRGTKTAAEVVVAEVRSERGGGRWIVGQGECVPYPRYRESVEGVLAALRAEASAVANGLDRDGLLEAGRAHAAS